MNFINGDEDGLQIENEPNEYIKAKHTVKNSLGNCNVKLRLIRIINFPFW
jgi:hypothetical protein